VNFSDFIHTYKQKLFEVFNQNADEAVTYKRGIPENAFTEIMEVVPLSSFIPAEYGGRGALTHEALSMLEASSYESLPLSLMMGINGALFLQPLANYGTDEAKEQIFKRFLQENSMGGLMITEPDYGSDALKMQTAFSQNGDPNVYHINGTKHWGGLTGWADYWLITARSQDESGNLGRDIGFFVHDSRNGGIEVAEYYPNLGLHMLPYGRNEIDINVQSSHKLQPKSNGITMMLDILHRSRIQFPGMGMGFLKRIMDDAFEHCRKRFVGGKSLFTYDQVQKRISELQSYFTVCSAMCSYTSINVPLSKDTSRMDVQANAIKTVLTDYMQAAAQSLLQLTGAKGYRLDNNAGRAVIDSRPFQIFEGSNDILYQQISESVLKMMRKMKTSNLYSFISEYNLTSKASGYFKDVMNFEVDTKMSQRKLVELGKALGRLISMEFTIDLGDRGFNKELVENAVKNLQTEIRSIMCSFNTQNVATIVEDYEADSAWLRSLRVDAG
jgi:alkylation response protein AidB-like acyl-CoA dehydrogenase